RSSRHDDAPCPGSALRKVDSAVSTALTRACDMKLQPHLSICTTIKNRSRLRVDGHELRLFPNCVASIIESIPKDLHCELVVTDWESDDWPLEEWLESAV